MPHRASRAAGLALALLLCLLANTQQARGQEDCFNDDDRLSRNDLEPPTGPTLPALRVSDEDLASVLAAIAKHEGRVSAMRAQGRAQSSVQGRTNKQ